MTEAADGRLSRRWLAGVFLLSAAVLAFEIGLLRMMLVGGWYHFAFLVISISLLGFGVSGVVLSLARPRLLRHAEGWLTALGVLLAVSLPLCTALAQRVEVEARFVPATMAEQARDWALVWGLWTIPFVLGGMVTGLALMRAGQHVGRAYAADLAGAGIGALSAPLLMFVVPVESFAAVAALPAALGALLIAGTLGRRAVAAALVPLLGLGLWVVLAGPPTLHVDPWKAGALMARLEAQGSAQEVARAEGPRGRLQVFESEAWHDLPFLGARATPPPLLALLRDGHAVGSVLRVDGPDEAAAVDDMLSAAAWALAPAAPRALLLQENAGVWTWMGLRAGAREVVAVQPDGLLVALLQGPLAEASGGVWQRPGVRIEIAEPRLVLERSAVGRWDLIGYAGLEAMSAGSSGIGGLGQDNLLTVQGMRAAWRALAPEGVLALARGMQDPPRDNLRILALVGEVLRREGIADPRAHVVVLRDYLGVLTVVSRAPFEDPEAIRALARERELTPVWFPGVRAEELNRPDRMPGPEGEAGDWYATAAAALLAPEAASARAFVTGWRFDIRPPVDDRPFFADFFRREGLDELRAAYGDLWVTRAELGFLLVALAAVAVSAVAALLILVPLLATRRMRRALRHRLTGRTLLTFLAIGLGYLLLELALLSRMIHLLGDAVIASAVTIAGFLVFSGVGSLWAQRSGLRAELLGRRVVPLILLLGGALLWGLPLLLQTVAGAPMTVRVVAALLLLAPLAVAMGFPLPTAMGALDEEAPDLVPWAWGINACGSVLASPLALLIGMTWGFAAAGGLALVCYLLLPAVVPRRGRAPG